MLFSTPVFLFFFLPIVLIVYYLTPRILRNLILIFFSILFYMSSSTDFIVILLTLICINFFTAYLIAGSKRALKKGFLLVGVMVNLGVLFNFKYLSFFIGSILDPILQLINFPKIDIPVLVLPLALSFFTFHALSYLIDVYYDRVKPKKLHRIALYFLFFPHLIAGPIVRLREIADQLQERVVTLDDFSEGVVRFITGLAKKVLVADVVALVADEIFGIPPANMTPATAWLGIICFTLQIYFDFSAYSDMAIGLARMFGFKFPENFNYPYISKSIGEFWTRWHMTLYRWFRDYVYIPIGGNRCSPFKNYFNIIFVFFLTGMWHGAGWHYIVWGLIQGFFIITERFKEGLIMKYLWWPLKHVYALLAIMIGWVFFRSENLGYAFAFLEKMFIYNSHPAIEYRPLSFFINNERVLAIVIGILISMGIVNKMKQRIMSLSKSFILIIESLRLVYLFAILIISMLYVVFLTYNPFIYFRF